MNVLPELLTILEKDYQSKTTIPILTVIGQLLEGSDELTQYCLDVNVIYYLKTLLNQTNDQEIIKSILFCFSNIVGGTEDQISVMVFYDL